MGSGRRQVSVGGPLGSHWTADPAIGTITYAAPELLTGDTGLSLEADVYAFGVMLWEFLARERAFGGLLQAQIVHAVTEEGVRLACPGPPAHPGLADLAMRCLAEDPRDRPTFEMIAVAIARMEAAQRAAQEAGEALAGGGGGATNHTAQIDRASLVDAGTSAL